MIARSGGSEREASRATSPRIGNAQEVWVDLLADIIVEEVLNGQESEKANQRSEV